MKESLQNEVVLNDVPLRGFKLFMSHAYTGQSRLEELDEETTLEVLAMAHLYGFESFETTICRHLQKSLSTRNVCATYSRAHRLQLRELLQACRRFIFEDPKSILQEEAFYDLSESEFLDVISLDTFCVDELEIFTAVERWCTRHPTHTDLSNIIHAIRLPLIDTKHLVTTVSDSGLVSEKLILDAIRHKECHAGGIRFRTTLNLASSDCGALILKAKPTKARGLLFMSIGSRA